MISTKTTIRKSAFLAFVFCVPNLLAQNSDFQQTMRKDLVHFGAIHPKGEGWEAEKKLLATHSQEELAKAMFAEMGLDQDLSGTLNNSVRKLYRALDLPPSFICQELEKTDSPGRKVALMHLLEGYKQPEVTTELLRQIKDHRTAYVIEHVPDIAGLGRSMRVCDVACNTLSYNLEAGGSNRRIFVGDLESRKDQIIVETLINLHLSAPNSPN